jgi:hypothetical protein
MTFRFAIFSEKPVSWTTNHRKEVRKMADKKNSCGCGCIPLPPKKGKKSK